MAIKRAHTTTFIVDADYFAAHLDNGGVRVGLKGECAVDFPSSHELYAAVVALKDETQTEAFFDTHCIGRIFGNSN